MRLIDSHCHLADEAFRDDLEAVIGRSRAAGLQHALCILAAGDAAEADQADRLSALWPDVRFATGIHPHQAAAFAGRTVEALALVQQTIRARSGIRALGEIGLDYHYDFAPREVQREIFGAQVRLARELRLPIVVHTREADGDTLAILASAGGGDVEGVLHCFTGDATLAHSALVLGFLLSFAGIVTFPRAAALRETSARVPSDRLLVESDSPFLAPVPHRGRRNEPAWIARTVEALAVARGATPEQVAGDSADNFSRLFRP